MAAAACRPAPERPSLLLVTVDTLRADRLGCYGHPEPTSPAIDRLAQEGVRFTAAWATAPITAPSHASLLTGRHPLRHGVRSNGLYRLEEGERTLAEMLAERGFATAAFVGAVPLDHRFGFAQGFDRYDDDFSRSALRHQGDVEPWYGLQLAARERRADEVVEPALGWLEAAARDRRPFFLWVHLFDPHSPYRPPAGEPTFYRGADPKDPGNRSLDGLRRNPQPWHRWLDGITDAAWVEAQYDGEVAFADRQVGRLLAALDRLGRRDDTVVALVADHGEGLGEHGEWFFHGDLVFEPTLRVPFLLRAPWRVAAGRACDVATSGVDLLPTLLELLGLELAPAEAAAIDGVSLVGAVDGADVEPRALLAEAAYRDRSGGAIWALRQGRRKLVLADPGPGWPELRECYDLDRDPGEERSRCGGDPAFAAMAAELAGVRRRLERERAPSPEVPPEVIEALRSLGYQD